MTDVPVLFERWLPIDSLQEALSARNLLDWLSDAELEVWHHKAMRSPAASWLAGRWLGKLLVSEFLVTGGFSGDEHSVRFRDISIISSDGRGCRSQPHVYVRGRLLGVRLSLAHSRHFAYAAAGPEPGPEFGVDVADLEELGSSFRKAWFLDEEQKAVNERCRQWDDLRIWTAKEACYKACRQSEAFDPKRFNVRFVTDHSGEGTYALHPRKVYRIQWHSGDSMLRALAVLQSGELDRRYGQEITVPRENLK